MKKVFYFFTSLSNHGFTSIFLQVDGISNSHEHSLQRGLESSGVQPRIDPVQTQYILRLIPCKRLESFGTHLSYSSNSLFVLHCNLSKNRLYVVRNS